MKSKLPVLFLVWMLVTLSGYASEPKVKGTSKPIDLTKATFLEKVYDFEKNPDGWKYAGDKPAILDFHANWCLPCRVTSPRLVELAAEYGGDIYIYKIDVDKEPELAYMFGANSLPMFLFIPMEGDPKVAVGALPKKSFREAIDGFLLKGSEE